MSDPNDVWQNNGSADRDRDDIRERSPRAERERSPRRERDRSRSPARNGGGGGGGGDDRGRDAPAAQNQGNNLHVSGIARSIDERMLEEIFSTAGKVYKAEIMLDPHTRESRGFGFVKMDTSDDANAAIEKLNQTLQEGKTMTVAHARRGRARTPTPGRYHGVKVDGGPPGYGGGGGGRYGGGGGGFDRPYQPRSYDSRYSDRGPPRYDDRRYDDRRYDDRGGSRYDDRRYDDRRYDDRRDDPRGPPPADRDYYRSERPAYSDRREERPRYEERPPRY